MRCCIDFGHFNTLEEIILAASGVTLDNRMKREQVAAALSQRLESCRYEIKIKVNLESAILRIFLS